MEDAAKQSLREAVEDLVRDLAILESIARDDITTPTDQEEEKCWKQRRDELVATLRNGDFDVEEEDLDPVDYFRDRFAVSLVQDTVVNGLRFQYLKVESQEGGRRLWATFFERENVVVRGTAGDYFIEQSIDARTLGEYLDEYASEVIWIDAARGRY